MEDINREALSVQSPVLDLSESRATETDRLLGQKSQTNSVQVEAKLTKRWTVSSKTIRNLFTAVCLWLGYFVVSACYSLFGPFFPEEVS